MPEARGKVTYKVLFVIFGLGLCVGLGICGIQGPWKNNLMIASIVGAAILFISAVGLFVTGIAWLVSRF